MTVRPAVASVLGVVVSCAAVAAEPTRPTDIGLEERVDVRMVLLDVLVLDRQGRTKPDLTRADFELLVDGRTVAIETLDCQCPLGAAEDPRAVPTPGEAPAPGRAPGGGRVVLVFDLYHMSSANRAGSQVLGAQALRAAKEAVDSGRIGASEYMVVSMGDVMRVESSFTSDRDVIDATLDRMTNDPGLYRGPRGLTEFRFFDRLLTLLDLMEAIPGRKAVVLFSGPLVPDGFTHDVAFGRLAAMSATSRTAIYPVDSGGLRTPDDPDDQILGGPPMLRRLADETGGRMTADTNDLALGPAKAGRDLGCTYTLGFRDPGRRKPDRSRQVTVLLPERSGLRAVYSASYVVRSPGAKARSLLETASIAPQSFRSDGLRADLVLSAPRSPRRWNATIAVSIEPHPGDLDAPAGEREIRGFLRTPSGTTLHSFRRRISAPTEEILERLTVRPGHYVLSAVLSSQDGGDPITTVREVDIPRIPVDSLAAVGEGVTGLP